MKKKIEKNYFIQVILTFVPGIIFLLFGLYRLSNNFSGSISALIEGYLLLAIGLFILIELLLKLIWK